MVSPQPMDAKSLIKLTFYKNVDGENALVLDSEACFVCHPGSALPRQVPLPRHLQGVQRELPHCGHQDLRQCVLL